MVTFAIVTIVIVWKKLFEYDLLGICKRYQDNPELLLKNIYPLVAAIAL